MLSYYISSNYVSYMRYISCFCVSPIDGIWSVKSHRLSAIFFHKPDSCPFAKGELIDGWMLFYSVNIFTFMKICNDRLTGRGCGPLHLTGIAWITEFYASYNDMIHSEDANSIKRQFKFVGFYSLQLLLIFSNRFQSDREALLFIENGNLPEIVNQKKILQMKT